MLCKTQAEFDAQVKMGVTVDVNAGHFEASGNAQVWAYDSAQVTASGSAQVRAYGNAQVTASGNAQVTAYDSAQVTASKYVAVTFSAGIKVTGGVQIKIPLLKTVRQWCSFYGLPIKGGMVTLFKAVSDTFKASHNDFDYTPGTIPIAPDWDGGKAECGNGLHFSPRPFMALEFCPNAERFVACPIAVKDIAMHPKGKYPQKVKASRCCAPVWECDVNGKPIAAESAERRTRGD